MGHWQLLESELGRLAARQHGLVTREQTLAAGGSVELIEHRLRTRRWERMAPGVYRFLGAAVTWNQRALAACMDAGDGAFVSHRSAAVLWGVSAFRPGRVEITAPSNRTARNRLALVHRSIEIPGADVTMRDRIPVSQPARMVVDLAGAIGRELLAETVDDVLCRRLISPEHILRRAQEMGPRRGSRALRSILEPWVELNADGEGDSGSAAARRRIPANPAEVRILRMLRAHGLPRPVSQYEIWEGKRFIGRVDLAYPNERIAIELDSFRWHAGRGAFRKDRIRGNEIEEVGWHLLRATTEDARAGEELCRVVRRLLAAAAVSAA